MSDTLTPQDLANAKLQVASITEFNESTNDTHVTPQGKTKKTTAGIIKEAETKIENAVNSAGFDFTLGSFASGVLVSNANQVLNYEGNWYKASAATPFTTDGATPTLDSREWLAISLQPLQQVLRSLNLPDSAGILDTDTVTPIPEIIYSIQQQKAYAVPAAAQGKTLVSVVDNVLNVTVGGPYLLLNTSTVNDDIRFTRTAKNLAEMTALADLAVGMNISISSYKQGVPGGGSTFKAVDLSSEIGITSANSGVKLQRTSGHSQLRDSLGGISPVIAAHRGFAGITQGVPVGSGVDNVQFVPENTAESIKFAADRGAWAVEGDTRITSDNKAVVFHDTTVDRTTDGTGPVNSFTLEQLKSLDAGAYVSQRYAGSRILDYDEFFCNCRKHGIVPMCEWSASINAELADAFVESMNKYYSDGSGVLLYSGTPSVLQYMRDRSAEIALGIQAGYGLPPADAALDYIYSLGNGFVNLSGGVLSTNPEVIKKIRDRGLMISYAIANTPAQYGLAVSSGVDIITTDLPLRGKL